MAETKIIAHRAFERVIDSGVVDTEEIPQSPVTFLDDCINLTFFRKQGSLKQIAGFSTVKSPSQLPDKDDFVLTGFSPVDMHIFGLDKDGKEIYLLVYKNNSTNETRFFVTPYWNPDVSFSNCNVNKQPNSWIDEWLELTECMSEELIGISSDYIVTMASDFVTRYPNTNVDDYLNGFFIVNTTQGRANRFNYITDWSSVGKMATLQAKIRSSSAGTDWAIDDEVKIYRFPVCHLYKADASTLVGEGETFDGLPTQFKYRENQLRIPCGKENRPLILDFIQNRKFFLGNDNSMSYEGFWFDFQSIPQVMRNSAITGFKTRSGGTSGGTSWDIQTGTLTTGNGWTTATAGRVNISCYSGTMQVGLAIIASSDPFPVTYNLIPGKVGIKSGAVGANNFAVPTIYFKPNLSGTLSAADFESAFNSGANPFYPQLRANVSSAGNIDTVNYTGGSFPVALSLGTKTFISETGTIFSGIEAGGNDTALNPFLGIGCYAVESSTGEIVQRNLHILNAIIDNKMQMLISHGTFSAKSASHGLQVRITPWFSRRITGLSLFNQKIEDTTNAASGLPSYVIAQEKYPYFLYRKEMGSTAKLNINDIKHFQQYDIYDFVRGVNGELIAGIESASDSSNGKNMYTFDDDIGYWYVYFRTGFNGIASDGKGVRYTAKCNRYIDQDTTMNYERCEFFGQTNGRYFLIGVKNTVEDKPFESNDIVVYNIYAGAVSEYDTFLRDRFMPISFGDKDRLREIKNHNGYLFLTKDNNSFALEVNTDNEIKYRVIETKLGRGTNNPELLAQTPFGLVLPTSDGVWMLSQDGAERILNASNGKLNLYKTLYASATQKYIIYYKEYNELFLTFQIVGDTLPPVITTYIFIYNFDEQKWGGYYYLTMTSGSAGIKPSVFREDTNNNIVFFNYDDSNLDNFRILKIDEDASTFIKTDGTSQIILWKASTHKIPYSGALIDTQVQKIGLSYDCTCTGAKNIIFSIGQDELPGTSYTIPVSAGSLSNKRDLQKEFLPKFKGIGAYTTLQIENNSSNGFTNFCLNRIALWVSEQNRKLI